MGYKKLKRLRVNFIIWSLIFLSLAYITFAVPYGPDDISIVKNETSSPSSGYVLNTSGGTITTINITATTQNTRWKAYIGNITNALTLDDASGSTIYDWAVTSVAGEVYATRNTTTPDWTNIKCANDTILENENILMNHSNSDDNITKTFDGTTHNSFYAGTVLIPTDECPTTNTYVNSTTQDENFEETVLYDGLDESLGGGRIIYTTIINQSVQGYNNDTYDFQILLPENGLTGFVSSTAYYFYVELA